jgi:hypothetical protein
VTILNPGDGNTPFDGNLLTTNFASITKTLFSNSEGEVEAKTGFFQQQVLLYSKYPMSLVNEFRACAHS